MRPDRGGQGRSLGSPRGTVAWSDGCWLIPLGAGTGRDHSRLLELLSGQPQQQDADYWEWGLRGWSDGESHTAWPCSVLDQWNTSPCSLQPWPQMLASQILQLYRSVSEEPWTERAGLVPLRSGQRTNAIHSFKLIFPHNGQHVCIWKCSLKPQAGDKGRLAHHHCFSDPLNQIWDWTCYFHTPCNISWICPLPSIVQAHHSILPSVTKVASQPGPSVLTLASAHCCSAAVGEVFLHANLTVPLHSRLPLLLDPIISAFHKLLQPFIMELASFSTCGPQREHLCTVVRWSSFVKAPAQGWAEVAVKCVTWTNADSPARRTTADSSYEADLYAVGVYTEAD